MQVLLSIEVFNAACFKLYYLKSFVCNLYQTFGMPQGVDDRFFAALVIGGLLGGVRGTQKVQNIYLCTYVNPHNRYVLVLIIT